MSNLIKTDSGVTMIYESRTSARFEIDSIQSGFGSVVGKSLSHILLGLLDGFAVIGFKIEGVEHEFSSIKGVVDNVSEIAMSLKQIRFKKLNNKNEKILIKYEGNEKFTAGDISKFTKNYEILNPELVIFNCDSFVSLNIELMIGFGSVYQSAEDNAGKVDVKGMIFIDAIFSPVLDVQYKIEKYFIEKHKNYESLVIDITTDGSIDPKDALINACKLLKKCNSLMANVISSIKTISID